MTSYMSAYEPVLVGPGPKKSDQTQRIIFLWPVQDKLLKRFFDVFSVSGNSEYYILQCIVNYTNKTNILFICQLIL